MTQEQAKEFLPIIQAYAEGKTVQWYHDNEWNNVDEYHTFSYQKDRYRIKPELQYRPFKNATEFEPFRDRWIINKDNDSLYKILCYNDDGVGLIHDELSYEGMFYEYLFDDGTPFGICEEAK